MIADYFAFVAAADTGLSGTAQELVNSTRAYRYAHFAGIPWLADCDHCLWAYPGAPSLYPTAPNSGTWAPWYHPSIAHSAEFLGVIGLEVTGGDDSTRKANVSRSLSGGGTIGAHYYQPRTLVIRVLAIAVTDAGLQVGLNWMQFTQIDSINPCLPPTLLFYDTCFWVGEAEYQHRRGLRQARITEGPIILERRPHGTMNSDIGCFATAEYTITCGDPVKHAPGALLEAAAV